MTTELSVAPVNAAILSSVLLDGNLAKLNEAQRVEYMIGVCKSLGLNPLTKPFEFITLNGKLTMYAKRDCTEQLRKIHQVSVTIKAREVVHDCYVVTATAMDGTGRSDESIGSVSIANLKGEALSNAMMKAETKAKRRVTLSICGLGLLDENEVSSIPGAVTHPSYQGPSQAERNGALVAAGQEPEPRDLSAREAAKPAYKELFAFDKDVAKRIWNEHGTDYAAAKVALEAEIALFKLGDLTKAEVCPSTTPITQDKT